ncbi:MAG: RluA family pseudouridine synthase [Chitinophagaceae bacterium]|nr:RluA family pseudouridine synthase [Chitinophagaceae bacterium]MBK8953001.1 RluA family pseudouridine synthase [Chitinophagaceae bacterium]
MIRIQDWIIAENDDFVALNKPSGLLSIPDREGKEVSLKVLLKEKYGKIFTVHRLDKDTSGLIIFAKNETAHKFLSQQFENRKTLKIYQGLVLGSPIQKEGSIDAPIAEHPAQNGTMIVHRKGKEALTDYTVLADFGIYSFLQFRIHTGRTHQIRVHMKDTGHPIICDPLYGDGKPVLVSSLKTKFKLSKNEEEERPIMGRLALHAYQLSIEGTDGKPIHLEAPLPKDIRATLQQLEKRKK